MINEAEIIRGITLVDPEMHNANINYRSDVPEGEGVHVIEIANGFAEHLGKIIVFGRRITNEERDRRIAANAADPNAYARDHLRSLSRKLLNATNIDMHV